MLDAFAIEEKKGEELLFFRPDLDPSSPFPPHTRSGGGGTLSTYVQYVGREEGEGMRASVVYR